ncbi:MAG: adenylate/guanylate cyclase domain-containing protein [Balneola sp.]
MPSKKTRRKPIGIYLLIAGLAFLVSSFLSNIPTFRSVELDFRDFLFEVRGPLSIENSPIVLIPISDEADSEIPQKYPWPTNVYAKLIENLNKAGVKVIVFDVIFDQPDQYDLKNDTLFAQALKEYSNVILAGDFREEDFEDGKTQTTLFPQQILQASNPNPVGLVDVNPNTDGAIRTYSFGTTFKNQDFYKLGIEALIVYDDIDRDSVSSVDDNTSLQFQLGNYSIQKDAINSFIINYYDQEGAFPTYDFAEVIDDTGYTTVMEQEAGFPINAFEDPDFEEGWLYEGVFENKIAIIGATMPALKDFYKTPLMKVDINSLGEKEELLRPGYEIHAHAIQTILDNNYLSRQNAETVLLLMAIFSLLLVLINRFFGPVWGGLSMFSFMGGYTFIVIQTFLNVNLFLNLTAILLTLFLAQVGTIAYQYFVEQKEKRRIKGMFSSYVSPKLVEQMVESGTDPQLGGDQVYMTAFFSDIESFSTFSEQMSPTQLVTLINEYLTSMTNILTDKGGTLDKYIGDAIVAFFGAPLPFEDHALRACVASQLMQKELNFLRKKWHKDGWPDIVSNMKNRIGMNTGDMITGNMGSENRFNYTMMGDNVNLAARCESGAKAFGVYNMITETTKIEAEKFGNDCVFRYLDKIVVKGRTQPVKMFEVADLRSEASQKLFDCIGLYEKGMEKYSAQNWDEAVKFFGKSLKLEAYENNPSIILLDRAKELKKNPPGDQWNGVFVMKSK